MSGTGHGKNALWSYLRHSPILMLARLLIRQQEVPELAGLFTVSVCIFSLFSSRLLIKRNVFNVSKHIPQIYRKDGMPGDDEMVCCLQEGVYSQEPTLRAAVKLLQASAERSLASPGKLAENAWTVDSSTL